MDTSPKAKTPRGLRLQYSVDEINRAIADALEAGELVEVEDSYVVADD